jgi:hypothetical protein
MRGPDQQWALVPSGVDVSRQPGKPRTGGLSETSHRRTWRSGRDHTAPECCTKLRVLQGLRSTNWTLHPQKNMKPSTPLGRLGASPRIRPYFRISTSISLSKSTALCWREQVLLVQQLPMPVVWPSHCRHSVPLRRF